VSIPQPKLSKSLLILGLCAMVAACGPSSPSSSRETSASEPNRSPDALHLLFTYGSEKEDWIKAVTERFNASQVKTSAGHSIVVEAVAQGSGDLLDDLLNGTRHAHLTSPASGVFVKLANAQSRGKTGKDLIGETQNLVLSPVVIAMWRPMAEAIGWGRRPVGWGDVLRLATNPDGWAAVQHPEWGPFRLGHTHPDSSNSGLISLLAEAYAGAGKVAGLTTADVKKPETARFMAGIESSIVHYGSSTGFFGKKMFSTGPRYLSAAVLYESLVIDANSGKYQMPFPVVAIYPKEGTFWSDHPVGIVNRPWVTPEHREAAMTYIQYLLARPQQEEALRFGFRPSAVEVQLAAPVDAAHGVDPKEPQTTLEVPNVEVIDAVRQLWRANKKHSSITLVLDISGSMSREGKIENAKAGALQLLTLLDDQDDFSLLPFSSELSWAVQDVGLGSTGRATVSEHLNGLFPDGETALYDSVAAAYSHQMEVARKDPGRISAVVVLTDGEDNHSHLTLAQLLSLMHSEGGSQPVRVFTIGYGSDANTTILEQIADVTQARFYQGTPANIRTVFRDISTFF